MKRLTLWISCFLLAAVTFNVQGFGIGLGQVFYTKYGSVFARGIVKDQNGNAIWVEYGEDGLPIEGSEIEPADDPNVLAMSGFEYRGYLNQLTNVQNEYIDDEGSPLYLVMTKGEYDGRTFLTKDGFGIVKPKLKSNTLTVAVRNPDYLYGSNPNNLLLLEIPVTTVPVATGTVSLLINTKNGEIKHEAEKNIGLLTGFFKREDEPDLLKVEQGEELSNLFLWCGQGGKEDGDGDKWRCQDEEDQGENGDIDDAGVRLFSGIENIPNPLSIPRGREDIVYDPLPGVSLHTGMPFPTGRATTEKDGSYEMSYFLPGCSMGPTFFTTYAFAELSYETFNPRAPEPIESYWMRRIDFDFCIGGMLTGSQQFTLAKNPLDFPVDVMMLMGRAFLVDENGAKISPAGKTEYEYNEANLQRITQNNFDFDNDGIHETSVLGDLVQVMVGEELVESFVSGSGEYQGIYLSTTPNSPGAEGALGQPNFTRLADWTPDFDHQGLLREISLDDFKDTDILAFRVSNGQLVAVREGLKASESKSATYGVDEAKGKFFYGLMLRGARERYHYVPPWSRFVADIRLPFIEEDGAIAYTHITSQAGVVSFIDEDNTPIVQNPNGGGDLYWSQIPFADWQASSGMAPAFEEMHYDHIRPGEKLKIIAINRKTGYMGSIITEMQTPSTGDVPGRITFPIDEIEMGPPNLKIWAERVNSVDYGATQGNSHIQMVGSEGATLADDNVVVVFTEWLDQDGSALPQELAPYGFTARLSKLVGNHSLAAASGVSQVAVKPGRNMQFIKLKGDYAGQQLYVQVSGIPIIRAPDFSTIGGHSGKLADRPKNFVPFQVPIFNEKKTNDQYNAYRAQIRLAPESNFQTPEPIYEWAYRPDYMFSVLDFEMQEIRRFDSEESSTNILPEDIASISDANELVNLLYTLGLSNSEQLDRFSGDQEIILALGEKEFEISISSGGLLSISDFSHLVDLSPEDFLFISLYQNNDAANVLWEFAFGLLPIPLFGFADVSADDEIMEFAAFTPMGELNDEENYVDLRWTLTGGGSLSEVVTHSTDGIHKNNINLNIVTSYSSPVEHGIEVEVIGSNDPAWEAVIGIKQKWGPYTVWPGKTDRIDLVVSKSSLPTDEKSETSLTAVFYDKANNLVEPGTGIDWSIDGSGELTEYDTKVGFGGVAKATYTVGSTPEDTEVRVEAVGVNKTATIGKTPLNVSIVASDSSVPADAETPIQLNISVAGSAEIDGTEAYLFSTLGDLSATSVIVSGSNATVNLTAPGTIGTSFVTVNVLGYTATAKIEFTQTDQVFAELEYASIVDEDSEGGIVEVENLQGSTIHSYVTTSDLKIYGTPGEVYTISPGGLFTPNAKNALHFTMDSFDDVSNPLKIIDQISGIEGSLIGDVSQNTQSGYAGGSSLEFNGGHVLVSGQSALNIDYGIFTNVKFKASEVRDQQILIQQGSGSSSSDELKLIDQGGMLYLQASINTTDDNYILTSDTPVPLDQWIIAGIGFRNGQLTLGIDDKRQVLPASGTLQGTNQSLALGYNFRGLMDDVQISREESGFELISVDHASVTIGSDGTATTKVRAKGKDGLGQTVGFTVTRAASTASFELPFRSPRAQRMLSRLLPTVYQVEKSYADPTQLKAYEEGVVLVSKEMFGAVSDYFLKTLIGEDNLTAIKTAATFLAELTSINDAYVLVKAIIAMADGRYDEINGFEVTFAAIGVGLTVFAIVSSGGATLPALKLALGSFKSVLILIVKDIGLDVLYSAGKTTAKFIIKQLKQLRSSPNKAKEALSQFGEALSFVVNSGSAVVVKLFVTTARTPKSFASFLKLFGKAGSCAVSSIHLKSLQGRGSSDLFAERLLPYYVGPTLAAGLCNDVRDKIIQIAGTPHFGDNAGNIGAVLVDVNKRGGDILNLGEGVMSHLSNAARDGMAEVSNVMMHLGKDGSNKLIKARFDELFKYVDEEKLGIESIGALNQIFEGVAKSFKSNPGLRTLDEVGKVQKAIKELINVAPRKITGTAHMFKDINKRTDIDKVLEFERKYVEDLGKWPLHPDGRIVDAAVEIGGKTKHIEYKGFSSSDWGTGFGGKPGEEFLTDVVIFARQDINFEWLIQVPPANVGRYAERMGEMLGTSAKNMDQRLKTYLKTIPKNQRGAFNEKLDELRGKLENGELVKGSTYG